MPVVALLSQKGGVGKTLTTVNLAAAAAADGLRAVIIDVDPQGSASSWHAVREASRTTTKGIKEIGLEVANAATLPRLVDRLSGAGAWVFIDTPPHNASLASIAASAADLCLCPTKPAPFDLAAIPETAKLVEAAKPRLAASILNELLASSAVAPETREFLKGLGLPVVSEWYQRMSYRHAAAVGCGVVETEPARGKARLEVLGLWTALKGALTEEKTA